MFDYIIVHAHALYYEYRCHSVRVDTTNYPLKFFVDTLGYMQVLGDQQHQRLLSGF